MGIKVYSYHVMFAFGCPFSGMSKNGCMVYGSHLERGVSEETDMGADFLRAGGRVRKGQI